MYSSLPEDRSVPWAGTGGGRSGPAMGAAGAGAPYAMGGSVPTGRILLRSARAADAAAPGPPATGGAVLMPLMPGLWTEPVMKLETSEAV